MLINKIKIGIVVFCNVSSWQIRFNNKGITVKLHQIIADYYESQFLNKSVYINF